MVFFFDENFPKKAIKVLNQFNHSAVDIRGTDKEGLDDFDIFQLCKKNKAVFLTTDKDFYHTIHLKEKPHFGIVVIALSQPNTIKINEKLFWFLSTFKMGNLRNKCFLILDNKCRIY